MSSKITRVFHLLSLVLFLAVICYPSADAVAKRSAAVLDADKKIEQVELILSRLNASTVLDEIAAMRQQVTTISHIAGGRIVELEEDIAQIDLATQRSGVAEDGSKVTQSIISPQIQRNKKEKEADLAAYALLELICQEKLELLDEARKKRLAHNLLDRGDDGITLFLHLVENPVVLMEGWQGLLGRVGQLAQQLKNEDFIKVAPDYFLLLPAMLMLVLVLLRKVVCRLVERYGEKGNLLYYFDLFLLGRGFWPNFFIASTALFAVVSWCYLRNTLVSLLLCWGAFALFYLLAAPFGLQAVYYRLAYSQISLDSIEKKSKKRLFRALSYLLYAMLLLHFDKLLVCFLQQDLSHLSHFLFLLLALVALWRVVNVLRRECLTPFVGRLLLQGVFPVALLLFILEGAGYRNLVDYLFTGISETVIVLALLLFFSDCLALFMTIVAKASSSVFGRFPVEKEVDAEALPDNALRLLGIALKLLLYLVFSYLLIAVWGAMTQLDALVQIFTQGIQIGGFSLYPARLIMAVVMLLAGFAVMGYCRQLIRRFWQHDSDISHNSQETILTLASYLGYALLTLFALSVAGVKLTGLSIVLGAFSVGIGFGLQNVVNNFISGLILMFERPIRRGNWVKVGDEQGYVKQISIRSTVIQTFDKADVIVPNSELISSKVTNMTLGNTLGRLKIPIGVAYGTDPKLVEKLLLGIAYNNPQVIHNSPRFRPRVYFLEFGDSALNFSLYCYLRDINNATSVRSEINFAIEREFRQHNIDIPFPQRVVTVKNSD